MLTTCLVCYYHHCHVIYYCNRFFEIYFYLITTCAACKFTVLRLVFLTAKMSVVMFRMFVGTNACITAYGSLGRHVSHRAGTRVRHSALSAALCAASAHDVHPNTSCSFSTIRRHVSFGLPIDLFPTGVKFITIRQSFVFSNRRTWPIRR